MTQRGKDSRSKFCPVECFSRNVQQVERLLDSVIIRGKSESVILCGPRGCGKTAIIEEALSQYTADRTFSKTFQCVYLDGAVEGDVKSSVESILRQTSPELSIRPNGGMTGSLSDKLKEMCDVLKHLSTENKSRKGFIFVIDCLEGFIEEDNQLLLYTLFESSRENDIPVCVIGVSRILDVLEKMEKRVKSRFSQRVICVSADLFGSFAEYKQAFSFVLRKRLPSLSTSNAQQFLKTGNIEETLKNLHSFRKDWNTIYRFVELIAACTGSRVTAASFNEATQRAFSVMFPDTVKSSVSDLPYLQLALLFCCVMFIKVQQESAFNYNMIREVYMTSVRQKKSNSFKFSDSKVEEAFHDLESCGVLRTTTKGGGNIGPREYKLLTLTVSELQIVELAGSKDFLNSLPTDLQLLATECRQTCLI